MKKILFLKGLPGSGKTTWAKSQKGYKRINKDDLRAMFDNSEWSKKNEKFIIDMRNILLISALGRGESVIIDDTNFDPEHEKQVTDIAKGFNIPVEMIFFDVPVEECIKRDSERSKPVGEKVIRDMATKWGIASTAYSVDESLPWCIICDIDGTLANIGNRSPYDAKNCHLDTVNDSVKELLSTYSGLESKTTIFLFSGRQGEYKPETVSWLANNGIPYDYLVMRRLGDRRKDSIIKEEFFKDHIQGKYNVRFVLDDRDQVVKMWRSIGLKCWQVNYGNF